MKRKTKPFWQIEMTAENLLNQCECYDKPYENIDLMIESCKIDIIPLDIDPNKLLGVLGVDKNGFRFIGYNKNMIPERILFTKAHELGHFILEHELKGELLTDTQMKVKNPQETEANVFAAALLMPKKAILNLVQDCLGIDRYSLLNSAGRSYEQLTTQEKNLLIFQMRTKFHTSEEAIYWRLIDILQ
jgi:Zn-dependent peptidase ImmA (M78 family)